MTFVLAKPEAGLQAAEVCKRIEQRTGLTALTPEQFHWKTIGYFLGSTGIPVNFGITIGIAVLIGLVVSGQTFYLFTIENLKQFGALKAIGVSNWKLIGMILLQALTVGAIGFSIGTGMAAGFFELTRHNIPTRHLVLIWQNVVGTGVLMFVVVILASLLSIRRVLVLEPAIVFRG